MEGGFTDINEVGNGNGNKNENIWCKDYHIKNINGNDDNVSSTLVRCHENEYTNSNHLNNEIPNLENPNLKNDENNNLNTDFVCDNTEKNMPPPFSSNVKPEKNNKSTLTNANNNEYQSAHTYDPSINGDQKERVTNNRDINENSNTVLEPQNEFSNNLNEDNATCFNQRGIIENSGIENETPNNGVYTNETPYLRGEEEENGINSEINVEEDNMLDVNNVNNVLTINNIINDRNSRSLASNSEEMNYYALTIRDNIINNNMNDNLNENEVHELRFYQRCFIGKILGYEIKPNLEEFNANKIVRAFLFLFILLGLFSIEFSLLYNNLLKINVDDAELLLIDSKYNDMFTRAFLFQFNKNKIKNLLLTDDMIKNEINKGNYKLYNDIHRVLNKLYNNNNNKNSVNNEKKSENIYKDAIRMYEKIKKKDVFIYTIKEFKFKMCRDIFKRINSNNSKNYLFIFMPTQNHLKITRIFIFLTIFFLCLRVGLISSRILYEFVLFFFYRSSRLSLNTKKGYLYKYFWSLCTVMFLEIILSDDCILWWVSDIDPIFSYHFQYFIWFCSIIYILTYGGSKLLKKWGHIRSNNSDNSSNNNIANIHSNNKYTYTGYILEYISKFLFGMNVIFAIFFILVNLGKPTVITIIITSAVLFVDILNDSYLEQISLTDFHNFTQNMQPKKKIYIIENKKKKQKKIALTRVNEHTYREFTMDDILEYEEKNKSKKYLGSTQSNINNSGGNENDGKLGYNKKKNIFNLKNIFNKRYLNGKWVYGRLSGGDSKCGEKSFTKREDNDAISNQINGEDASIVSSFEYCEICDERPKNIVLYPCMHGGFCELCIRSLIYNTTKLKYSLPCCPLCRKHIYDVKHCIVCVFLYKDTMLCIV